MTMPGSHRGGPDSTTMAAMGTAQTPSPCNFGDSLTVVLLAKTRLNR